MKNTPESGAKASESEPKANSNGQHTQATNGRSDDLLDTKGLPESIETERAILGASLLDNGVFPGVATLSPEDFFLGSHRRIFNAMRALAAKGSPIDFLTLTNALREAGEFEEIGGATFIAGLIDGVPRTDNTSHYREILKSKTALRRLLRQGEWIKAAAVEGEMDPVSICARSRAMIEGIEAGADTNPKGTISSLELGNIASLSWFCKKHFARNLLTLITGEPESLKTFFVVGLLCDLVAAGWKVCYVPLEGRAGIADRILAHFNGNKERMEAVMGSGRFRIWDHGLNFLDQHSYQTFRAAMLRERPDVIIIDTLADSMAGGIENDGTAFGIVIEAVTELMRLINCSFGLTHHPPKGDSAKYRGHSSLHGRIDIGIGCSFAGKEQTIDNWKQKEGQKFEPYFLAPIEIDLERVDEFGEPVSSLRLIPVDQATAEFEDKFNKWERQILEALVRPQNLSGVSRADLQKITDIKETTLDKYVGLLESKRGLVQSFDGAIPRSGGRACKMFKVNEARVVRDMLGFDDQNPHKTRSTFDPKTGLRKTETGFYVATNGVLLNSAKPINTQAVPAISADTRVDAREPGEVSNGRDVREPGVSYKETPADLAPDFGIDAENAEAPEFLETEGEPGKIVEV
jgi:hypothetical protein